MEATKPAKTFDAVAMMRGIRDKLSRETENMSFPELQQYLKQQLESSSVHPAP